MTEMAMGGASCVVAKRQGDSLAIEWVATSQDSAEAAMRKAEQRLLDQGYRKRGQDVHAQASSELSHAYVAIIKTEYTAARGKVRTSYGCGFSSRSAQGAEQAAIYDLRNYSWGWKAEYGYRVVEAFWY
ncbi:MAG: hypothetical protein KZQ99_17900 [Candidatus Thiodiazotropha sp. (ex Dulcina madagascariensis)]|nr:hypothetical protein [Candidatus Thiodiazotropha sp. (ex Dulcina madagascariensis)]